MRYEFFRVYDHATDLHLLVLDSSTWTGEDGNTIGVAVGGSDGIEDDEVLLLSVCGTAER